MMRRVLREPLVHFVLVGAVVFAAYGLAGSQRADPGGKIVVGRADIAGLAGEWRRRWGRAPAPDELEALVQSHVREQILYREALALGLDRNDTIVRRRMLQKMEFLGEAVAADEEPPAAELERFFLASGERYRAPAKVSFAHVYFSRDRRGAGAIDDARAALATLRSSAADGESAARLGDPFLLRSDYREQTRQDLEGLFGATFARAVFAIDRGDWQGPVESAYGFHLVRVRERKEARLPALEEVRRQVLADWREARRKEANGDFYAGLRERYEVDVDAKAFADASGRD
jgi:hypothetical protein